MTFGDPPVVPVVTGLDPVVGPTAGGTSVTVSGSGFTDASAVAFGSAPGSDVVVVSDSEITVTSPAGFVGDVFVRVTSPSGTSAESADAVFTYQPSAPVLGSIGELDVDEGVELSFTAVATDADVPAQTLTFTLENAPAGARIDAVTGVFSWTPNEADGPDQISFDVVVTDDGAPALEDRETITVTIAEVNLPPVADAGGDANAIVGQTVTLDGSASSDLDIPEQTLSYTWSFSSVPTGSTLTDLDDAASITPSFTPDVAGDFVIDLVVNDGIVDSPTTTVTITVTETSQAPVLGSIGELDVDEGVELSFTAVATDADVPAQTLTFTLENAPAGARIDAVTGVFSWTPNEADGPDQISFDVVVTDDGAPALEDRETITVTIAEVNLPPVADAGGDANAIVGQTVTLDGSASSDLDIPEQTLSYTWSFSSVPTGSTLTDLDDAASITPSFTPDVAGDFVIDLVVNDGIVDSPTTTITITATATAETVSVVLSPTSAVVGTNIAQAFSAEGFDAFGNSTGDLTAEAVFTISPNGRCNLNVCRSGTIGVKQVTAQVGTMTATATLDVRVRQTISFPTIGGKTMLESPVLVSATASSGLPVTFTTTTPDVCTAGGPDGSSITLIGPGKCTVQADQAGDDTWAPACVGVAERPPYARWPRRSRSRR